MLLLNLISLWLDPSCTERIILTGVNIFSHLTFMQQLSWYVPHNRDVLPSISKLLFNVIDIDITYRLYFF